MSKKGRGRRTKEQRLEARDTRSTIGYINRIKAEVEEEQFNKLMKSMAIEPSATEEFKATVDKFLGTPSTSLPVSETAVR